MASLERTAYPRLKRTFTAKDLAETYTPTAPEISFAKGRTTGLGSALNLLVMLKVFQRLGYFPNVGEIPLILISHIRSCLGLSDNPETPLTYPPASLYRHHKAIREYLVIKPYDKEVRHIATTAVYNAAQLMDNPADLINVAIGELIRQRCELPAFSTLDRLTRRVRSLVNAGLFHKVLIRLSTHEQASLETLLVVPEAKQTSQFNRLKELPKSATRSHLDELQAHLTWLLTLGEVEKQLAGIPNAKIKYFAALAGSLDAAEMGDFTPARRYTLILALIYQARVTTRDDLADMLVKRVASIHLKAKEELVRLREEYRTTTERLLGVLTEMLQTTEGVKEDTDLGQQIRETVAQQGGSEKLLAECIAVAAYNSNNHLPLLWKFYQSHRSTLFRVARRLTISSTTQDQTLIKALEFVLDNQGSRGNYLPNSISLSFASAEWQRLVLVRRRRRQKLDRRNLEVCVFSYLASELRTGDVAVEGSENYADYRTQLLSWQECEPLVEEYCHELGFKATATDFVAELRDWLTRTADKVDTSFPQNKHLTFNKSGEPVLARLVRKEPSSTLAGLVAAMNERLPDRHLLDVLGNVEHWTNWSRHFGPLSGSDPKLEQAKERYIITTFGYGCNLGPVQTAGHMADIITPHQISFVNHRHVNAAKLEAATRDVINSYNTFSLPHLWGKEKVASADGTKLELAEENPVSEYHIRYGGYGGIAYHHVSDRYIALFSHFINCGVWEAVYIIDGLLKNKSDIQSDTLHADTQGQSAPVFGLAHLLGIKLMPRIRNWKDLIFFRPSKTNTYQHLDTLFRDVIDWELIETHWQDLLRVVLSIRAGKVLPSTLLRKLGNYSHKNRLYQAFRELGRVVRTVFLLEYISDLPLREQIQATTNKVEAFNRFCKWFFFGGEGIIAVNDPDEQEKRIKYTDLVANAVMLQNVVDMTAAFRELVAEGYTVKQADVAALSPYLTRHIKRFGDYSLDLSKQPDPFEVGLPVLA